jgi:hypothetical protein
MMDKFGIRDFQFYDAFYSYSTPAKPGCWTWETKKVSSLLGLSDDKRHVIDVGVLIAYLRRIRQRGGRSWLYVQALGADESSLPGHVSANHTHEVNSQTLFSCYWPDEDWARRMCHVWAPFAQQIGFDGIHWDALGPCDGAFGDGQILGTFLRRTKTILAEFGLVQTANFVDGFGWDMALASEGVVEFPYWEVWTLPRVEDRFFEEMAKLPEENRGVFVCYRYGGHNPPNISPHDLIQGLICTLALQEHVRGQRWVAVIVVAGTMAAVMAALGHAGDVAGVTVAVVVMMAGIVAVALMVTVAMVVATTVVGMVALAGTGVVPLPEVPGVLVIMS